MTSLESFTAGQPVPVDSSAIELQLRDLWRQASSPGEGESGPAVMRACQLNLIVGCAGREGEARAMSVLDEVTRVWPSRVLMTVIGEAGASEGLEAFITAHCSYTPGTGKGKQVCCEQVTLVGAGSGVDRLPAAVLSLLLPDLPVVLWFPEDPCVPGVGLGDAASARLLNAVDRIVVDARRFAGQEAFLRLVQAGRPVADLAWQRLRGWRELVARQFDGPVFEDYPPQLERIRVEFVGDDFGCEAEALLLGCWAAGQLGWRTAASVGRSGEAGFLSIDFARPGGPSGELVLQRAGDGMAPGILGMTLESEDATFALRRDEGKECVSSTLNVPGACGLPRTTRLPERGDPHLLSRSLEAATLDHIYEQTLRLCARRDL